MRFEAHRQFVLTWVSRELASFWQQLRNHQMPRRFQIGTAGWSIPRASAERCPDGGTHGQAKNSAEPQDRIADPPEAAVCSNISYDSVLMPLAANLLAAAVLLIVC